MTDKIKFAISSNKTFSHTTYPIIINNLIDNGINPENIYFFEGDHTEYKQIENKEGINYYHIPYNSMDFNSLISVLELNIFSERWFILQDTCTINNIFLEKIINHPNNYPTTILCKYGMSMNIGSYSWNYLQINKERIYGYKNNGDINEYKTFLVKTEDCFLNEFKNVSHYSCVEPKLTIPTDIYGNGTQRIIQSYEDIGFHKTKANWFGKPIYEINL